MTSTTLLEERVLKTDVLGRVRTPVERREALLDEFERSGMSGRKFAEFIGVKYQTWASWVQGRRRRQGGGTAKAGKAEGVRVLRLVEAVVEAETPDGQSGPAVGALRVQLPGGIYFEVADRAQALLGAELLRVWQSHPPPRAC
jgi:hypothetical protein